MYERETDCVLRELDALTERERVGVAAGRAGDADVGRCESEERDERRGAIVGWESTREEAREDRVHSESRSSFEVLDASFGLEEKLDVGGCSTPKRCASVN